MGLTTILPRVIPIFTKSSSSVFRRKKRSSAHYYYYLKKKKLEGKKKRKGNADKEFSMPWQPTWPGKYGTKILESTVFFFTEQTNCKTSSIDFLLYKPKKKSFKKKHQNSFLQNLISKWKKWVQRRGGWWWLEEVLLVPCLPNLSNFMLMSPLLTRMCSIPFLLCPFII